MLKTSLRNTILLNLGAFFLVALLELLSSWLVRDQYATSYDFFYWQISYAVMIMLVIWVNHFLLIPFFLDKQRYFLYAILLLISIFLGAQIKAYGRDLISNSKIFFFLIYTTGSGMAFFYIRRSMIFQKENAEKEKLQKEMELNYLKEQVNPHFLFNSLNSIYSLAKLQSPETPELVMQLSELLRYQLESSKMDAVSLKKELEFIENYLLLEEKRLSERCTIELNIEANLRDFTIAPMLLIPFVENAIKHGAHSTNQQSYIHISALIEQTLFHFSVINSKPKEVLITDRKGFGLENVKKRLGLLYPDAHTLMVSNQEKEYQIKLSIDLSSSKIKSSLYD